MAKEGHFVVYQDFFCNFVVFGMKLKLYSCNIKTLL